MNPISKWHTYIYILIFIILASSEDSDLNQPHYSFHNVLSGHHAPEQMPAWFHVNISRLKFLTVPKTSWNCRQKVDTGKVKVVVAINSRPEHVELRRFIRKTWGLLYLLLTY